MKNNKIIACFMPFLLIACANPYGSSKDITDLKNMLMGSRDAWNKGEIRTYMSFYANDSNTQFISKRGRTKGWQNTLEMYLKSYPNEQTMGHLDFELDTIQILSSKEGLGQVTGKWKLIRATDTPGGFFSLITKQTTVGPKIIIDHTW